MEQNIFEAASRKAFRFDTVRGLVTTEQLWDISLTSRNGFDLDTIGRDVIRQLREVSEESLVAKANPLKPVLELKLAVIKHIIETKQAEAEKARLKAARAVEREKLLGAMEKKQDASIENMSEDAIKARLKELDEE